MPNIQFLCEIEFVALELDIENEGKKTSIRAEDIEFGVILSEEVIDKFVAFSSYFGWADDMHYAAHDFEEDYYNE
jgi:hypothetical protein